MRVCTKTGKIIHEDDVFLPNTINLNNLNNSSLYELENYILEEIKSRNKKINKITNRDKFKELSNVNKINWEFIKNITCNVSWSTHEIKFHLKSPIFSISDIKKSKLEKIVQKEFINDLTQDPIIISDLFLTIHHEYCSRLEPYLKRKDFNKTFNSFLDVFFNKLSIYIPILEKNDGLKSKMLLTWYKNWKNER